MVPGSTLEPSIKYTALGKLSPGKVKSTMIFPPGGAIATVTIGLLAVASDQSTSAGTGSVVGAVVGELVGAVNGAIVGAVVDDVVGAVVGELGGGPGFR